jgi:prolyl oligopeptidase
MKRELLCVAVSSAMLALAGCATDKMETMAEKSTATTVAKKAYSYPSFARSSQVDSYPGDVKIADPFRGLEELDAPATREWINGQNAVTNEVLAKLPLRDAFKKRLTELWNFERVSVPYREGGRWFYSRNDGLQNQSVLYTLKSLSDAPQVLLDPNTLSTDGTVAINAMSVSPDGKHLAYALSEGGSDWQVWRIREIETGKDLPDKLEWSKFSGANWLKDGSGFYYGRFDKPEGQDALKVANNGQEVYLHKLGTDQSADVMVFNQPDAPNNMADILVTDDGMYMVNSISVGTDVRNLLYVKTVAAKEYTRLIDKLEASFSYIGNVGSTFYLLSNYNAPKYQLIAIDLKKPARANWKTVIAESDATLLSATMVGDSFIASYLRDAKAEVKRYSLDGKKSTTIQLPGLGKVDGFAGKLKDQETYFSFASYTNPSEIFKLDLSNNSVTSFKKPQVKFNSDDYMTQQVFYTSKDGTKVPMFITSKKGYVPTGETPVLLYGYGGFNIPMLPNFSPAILAWVEKGGLYAVANLRGGGEYGEAWHTAGTKTQKQNVFDDFVGAAEYLIDEGHTKAKKIAINGRSNGGLLVAATQLQRPELFGAAIPGVGVLDMLRFNQFTIGKAWESDYGSPQNAEEFAAIRKYSPLHNVQTNVEYPATLILTGDHDDRVFPAHSFKFAAQIQESYRGNNPMLIRIETRGGHGAGKPVSMQIEENADWMSFAANYIGLN